MRRDTERCGYAAITAVTVKPLWNFGTTDRHVPSRIVELLAFPTQCFDALTRGHIVMAVGKIVEGDTVILHGEVTRVSDDGRDITVRVRGYGIPLTVNRDHVETTKTAPTRRKLFDRLV
jgi:hypothetical protein